MKKILTMIAAMALIFTCGCQAKSEDLVQYKTSYVGDNAKVINIVTHLTYPNDAKYSHIQIHSEKEPYALDVFLKTNDACITDKELFNQAVLTFSLIDNLSHLNFIDEKTNETMVHFDRDDVDFELKKNGIKNTKELSESQDDLINFIQDHEMKFE